MHDDTQLITHPHFIRSLRCGRATFLLGIGALIVDLATDVSRVVVYCLPTLIGLFGVVSFTLAGIVVAHALGESRREMIAGTVRSLLVLPYLFFLDALNFWLRLIARIGAPGRRR